MARNNRANQIMDAAQDLFEEQGYKKTTMRDISAKSEAGLGLVTYHYKTKHQLAISCILRYFDIISQKIEPVVSRNDDPVLYSAVFFMYSHLFFMTTPCRTFYTECLEEGIYSDAIEESTLETAALIRDVLNQDIPDDYLFLYCHTIPLNIERTLILGKRDGKFGKISLEEIPAIAFEKMMMNFTNDSAYISGVKDKARKISFRLMEFESE